MRLSLLFCTLAVAALLTMASCGKRHTTRPVLDLPDECVIIPTPSSPSEAVTVALMAPVDPGYAPWARNSSEQLLFHQLYETLIARDCTGQVQPRLAESWERHDGGRRWTFVLRKGARFSDGSRVTAQDVLDSWQRAAVEPLTFYAEVEDVQPDGDRVLDVYFRRPQRDVPLAMSSLALAVTKPNEGGWPLGSGQYQMAEDALTARSVHGDDSPSLRFINAASHEPRDLLEGRVDMMITRDPSVVDYAAGREQLATIALPWDVTYVLLSTSRAAALADGEELPVVDAAVLASLARDAVRVEARGFTSRGWWADLGSCGDLTEALALGATTVGDTGSRRVVYDGNDPIARDLARRVVSLSGMSVTASDEAAAFAAAVPRLMSRPRLTARGLAADQLATSLWNGAEFAYIVAIPRRLVDPCYAGRQLVHRAPWLLSSDGGLADTIVPLVDSRRHVVARRERVGASVDWFGNVLVEGGAP